MPIFRVPSHTPDRFYAMCAGLSDRFGDAGPKRFIAAATGFFALPPLVAVITQHEHAKKDFAWMALAISTLLMTALVWGRSQWPSRRQSVSLLTGLVITAVAGVVLLTQPFIALLAALTSIVAALYAALFHRNRYFVFTIAAAAVTLAIVATRLEPDVGFTIAVSVTILTIALISVGPAVCWAATALPGHAIYGRNSYTENGLQSRAAFDRTVAELIGARSRQYDRYFVVTVMVLDELALLTAADGRVARERTLIAIADTLRSSLRNDAALCQVDSHIFVAVELFESADLASYANRIDSALQFTPHRINFSIGIVYLARADVVALPPDEVISHLIGAAIAQARNHIPGHTPPYAAVKVPQASVDE